MVAASVPQSSKGALFLPPASEAMARALLKAQAAFS